ncbi:hypothetical protein [Cytobacillus gottheilii]|uniref:Uncharacterized protein n=1 Tax=Cytobacillus gottheilii TaxID=859144 RepID=A0ABX8FG12_9BACI|nr:hypothetical protein [Cytobacillus gottheilii]QVY62970.1 hypothetical protein J1899_07985 [Cytobacillus gottheilii]
MKNLTAKHYIADESIGGIEREYVETNNLAYIDDLVVTEFPNCFTQGKVYEAIYVEDNGEVTLIDDEGDEHILSFGNYKTLEPTNIVRIDGARYRLVERKAEVGEKILIRNANFTFGDYANGDVLNVVESDDDSVTVEDYGKVKDKVCTYITHREYNVLEPIEAASANDDLPTVDATQASPQVIDMLANLARRVTSLESQLSDTQRNVETFAQQTESNTKDIAYLDERTTVSGVTFTAEQLSAIIEAIGGASR